MHKRYRRRDGGRRNSNSRCHRTPDEVDQNGYVILSDSDEVAYHIDGKYYTDLHPALFMSMGLTEFNKRFMQFMAVQMNISNVITEDDAIRHYETTVKNTNINQEYMNFDLKEKKAVVWDVIHDELNPKLTKLTLQLQKVIDEVDNEVYVVASSPFNYITTDWMARRTKRYKRYNFQLFLRILIETILSEPGHCIKYVAAINLTQHHDDMKHVKKTEAARYIKEMVADKCIIQKNRLLYIGPKGVRVSPDLFDDEQHCKHCNFVCLLGRKCARCGEKFHELCHKESALETGLFDKCGACKYPMPNPIQSSDDGVDSLNVGEKLVLKED